jgi:hypothetical protein
MPSINNFLKGFSDGLPGMKDYRHASRLYFDDNFKLAPKHKYLYHVVFDLDETVIGTSRPFTNNERLELNMLVKAIDLPKYNMNVDEKIQYNKKMYLATRIGYEPVNVTFHDDNADTVNAFWKTYYEYHIADSINTVPSMRNLNRDTQYDSNITRTQFGMDTAVKRKKPFLRGIDIFVLHKQRFTSFSLINPIIGSWAHDTLDQTDGQGLLQNTMQVFYETVLYNTGLVKGDGVPGFANLHYDNSPSPLSVLGGGTNSLFGPGGIVDGIGSVIGDVRNGQVGLGTILKGINTYNNARKIKNAKGQLKEELGGIVKDEIQKIGESAGTIANPVGNFSVGNAATTAALAGATIATAKGLIDEKNKNSTVVQNANIDTETYLTPSESTNLINNNPEVRTQIAANMYYKDIGSRKGLTVAESDLEFASASESVKNVYNSKASTNINKLVTEGYIKIDRASQNVNVSIESQGV